MVQLQVTETLYRLFTWKTGTYEFEQGPVESRHPRPGPGPGRVGADGRVPDGRRVAGDPEADPALRPGVRPGEVCSRAARRRAPLESGGEWVASVGQSERRVFALVNGWPRRAEADRPLLPRRVRDLQGALQPGQPRLRQRAHAGGRAGPAGGRHRARRPRPRCAGAAARSAWWCWPASWGCCSGPSSTRGRSGRAPRAGFAEGVLRQQIARAQVSRIEGALAVYRLERGECPVLPGRAGGAGASVVRPTYDFRGRSVTTTAAWAPRSSSSCRPCASLPGWCHARAPGALKGTVAHRVAP